ncbi:MAG: phosphatidate cytidylyltransferase [Thermoguttaceae bacterium]|jgi:phosphatidate cytidylyltransferase
MEEQQTLGLTLGLIGGVLTLLVAAETVLQILRHRADSTVDPAILETFRNRVRAWWILTAALAGAVLTGQTVTVFLFCGIAFWGLREFITLTPTRPGDHRTLFWVFFLFTPLQFVLVWFRHYGLYSILIPVYVFLFIPARIAFSGDAKRFLERSAKIQVGLLICVYCLSHAPALMTLNVPSRVQVAVRQQETERQGRVSTDAEAAAAPAPGEKPPENGRAFAEQFRGDTGAKARLLLFFVLMVQLGDVLQYAWAQIPLKHVIAPTINPGKTWEGLLGGTGSVMLLGAALWWATPFPVWLTPLMSGVIALMGFCGAMTMSAIKRDRGVKDYGTLVEGHGGVLDRIDSICFAAPIFFHLTRYWLISRGFILPIP